MYALAVSPLIKDLKNCNSKQVWYTDDSSAGGRLNNLKAWWESILERGPAYGYFANQSWLVIKEDKYHEAKEIICNTNLNITTEGRHYLGSALGNDSFIEAFGRNKVVGWVKEIETLSEFAKIQPHAAFAVYTHCTLHKWSFISRTTSGNSELL